MRMIPWAQLPPAMRNEAVRPYYDAIKQKSGSLFIKRGFDVVVSGLLLVLLAPLLLVLTLWIRLDSDGQAIFRQERVTQYGRHFHILKFRTMVDNAENLGAQVTAGKDSRVTRIGKTLRDTRMDELPQLFNIFIGDMSFVGVRPEVPRYVAHYTDEMLATLLLPAGVTSTTSILYKDEGRLLEKAQDVEKVYIETVMPSKMVYNLKSIMEFSCKKDLEIMLQTLQAVFFHRKAAVLKEQEL